VMAGQVRSDGEIVLKPSQNVPLSADIKVDQGPRYVSRGGEKLEAALQSFSIRLQGYVCADVGASTGGFTDCLLQNGAARVYAIDVGQGILHWKLRQHPLVVVIEKTNARFLQRLPEPVDLVTIDASFISLKLLLPVVRGWLNPSAGGGDVPASEIPQGGTVLVLIKPQFEAGRRETARGDGVIRDATVHRQVLQDVLTCAQSNGFGVHGLIPSPLLGPKGNIEFLASLVFPGEQPENLDALIEHALESGAALQSRG
jgi:23S rRNA (cytidine1920-2'-O)/16S rRNA (cytidine1409-2'-O)-methyltransferase